MPARIIGQQYAGTTEFIFHHSADTKQKMSKKIEQSEFEQIIQPLPSKDKIVLREQEITTEWLQENVARCRKLMKRDLWIGPLWVILYGILLFKTGYSNLTIAIFVIGAVYFIYTIFTTGSFGLNRKRVSVYEELLKKMEN